jgi:hypothetical protein
LKHDTPKRHLFLSLHGVAYHGERVRTRLAVGYDVIRFVEISLVDILGWNEIVDIDGVSALKLYRV